VRLLKNNPKAKKTPPTPTTTPEIAVTAVDPSHSTHNPQQRSRRQKVPKKSQEKPCLGGTGRQEERRRRQAFGEKRRLIEWGKIGMGAQSSSLLNSLQVENAQEREEYSSRGERGRKEDLHRKNQGM